jgi:hypothetical protein
MFARSNLFFTEASSQKMEQDELVAFLRRSSISTSEKSLRSEERARSASAATTHRCSDRTETRLQDHPQGIRSDRNEKVTLIKLPE